ncbi:MAG: BrnA antitoxin family protein [Deltaproteobacteria bacterium]|nr:BrnA antitoxin family protein [Deltaproteobacteria bacterium]
MMDEDIDLSDIPELDDNFFRKATLVLPKPKAVVTLRVDADVLQWFKARGKGYQTLMNAVLKEYSRHSTEHFPKVTEILKKEKNVLR